MPLSPGTELIAYLGNSSHQAYMRCPFAIRLDHAIFSFTCGIFGDASKASMCSVDCMCEYHSMKQSWGRSPVVVPLYQERMTYLACWKILGGSQV